MKEGGWKFEGLESLESQNHGFYKHKGIRRAIIVRGKTSNETESYYFPDQGPS